MKLVPDATRRFTQRPHYEPYELDIECEEIVSKFLRDRHGIVEFPIATDDLTLLIEREADDLDSSTDLSDLGEDVEGVTDFFRGKKPRVRIASHLWDRPSRENRLRTTLAHEFGHVHFHNYLYQVDVGLELFTNATQGIPLRCKRETIQGLKTRDWMEWQAGYVCGSLLMPVSRLRAEVSRYLSDRDAAAPLDTASEEALTLSTRVGTLFLVSHDAARVRLSQLGYLVDPRMRPLDLGFASN